jgi:hypothetical protein
MALTTQLVEGHILSINPVPVKGGKITSAASQIFRAGSLPMQSCQNSLHPKQKFKILFANDANVYLTRLRSNAAGIVLIAFDFSRGFVRYAQIYWLLTHFCPIDSVEELY